MGYIRSNDGKRKYEQFRVDRRAHYDEDRRTIIEVYVATEAIDEEGENELQRPEDACGFSILIRELSPTGDELARPAILMVRSTDFKDKDLANSDLLAMAQHVHALLADDALSSTASKLSARARDYLRSLGWRKD